MPARYRKALKEMRSIKAGRESLKRHKQFWGVALPPKIQRLVLPGPAHKKTALWGLGVAKELILADTPTRAAPKKVVRGNFELASDSKGKTILWFPRGKKRFKAFKWQKAGFVKKTIYIPTKRLESAGTFKAGHVWHHSHFDAGGSPPVAYYDSANGCYAAVGGTFKIDRWLRR